MVPIFYTLGRYNIHSKKVVYIPKKLHITPSQGVYYIIKYTFLRCVLHPLAPVGFILSMSALILTTITSSVSFSRAVQACAFCFATPALLIVLLMKKILLFWLSPLLFLSSLRCQEYFLDGRLTIQQLVDLERLGGLSLESKRY